MTAKRCVFQVPPKTFILDSWITELDHATNLVVSSKLRAVDWESPSAKSNNNNNNDITFIKQS